MKHARNPLSLAVLSALAAATLSPTAANAFEFQKGEWTGTIDTSVSYGVSARTEDPDEDLIGKARLNPGLIQQIGALQAQGRFLEAQQLQINAPGRFSVNGDDGNLQYPEAWDLFSNAFKITSEFAVNWRDSGAFFRATYFHDFTNDASDFTDIAEEKVVDDLELLDAFVFHNFSYGETGQGSVRLGHQVVSWGESTFIQQGINVINPVDVSRLRTAGAELKEAFLPIPMLWGSFTLTDNLSLEALYIFEFEQIEPDPSGTYFSTNDFATQGGTYVMLGFGTVPQPVNNPELFNDVCQTGPAGFAGSDTGLPPSLVGIGCSAAVPRAPDRYPSDSGQWGGALRYFAENLNETEFGFYYLNYHSRLPLISGISITNSSPTSGRYFVEYPDDIDLYGASFNTLLPGGYALQGEVSYRPNVPLQIDDVEILFAALSPLNPLIPQPQLRFNSQLGSFGPGEEIRGWDRHEVSQAQATVTKLFGNIIGAQQVAVVGEIGATKVWDLPSPDVLRYQGDGTDTGGGPDVAGGQLRNPLTQDGGFPTQFSWGYRIAARADYNSAFGTAFSISPRVAFSHDVNGTTPGPGGNFIEDRKSVTVGVEGVYLNQWSADLSYTSFFGAERFNLIHDRDFVSLSVRYSF